VIEISDFQHGSPAPITTQAVGKLDKEENTDWRQKSGNIITNTMSS